MRRNPPRARSARLGSRQANRSRSSRKQLIRCSFTHHIEQTSMHPQEGKAGTRTSADRVPTGHHLAVGIPGTGARSSRGSYSSMVSRPMHVRAGIIVGSFMMLLAFITGAMTAQAASGTQKPGRVSRCKASVARRRLHTSRHLSGCRARLRHADRARHRHDTTPPVAPPGFSSPSAPSATGSAMPAAAPPADWFGTFSPVCDDKALYRLQSPSAGYTDSGGGVLKCVSDPNGSGQTVLQMTVSPNTCAWSCEQRMDWDSPQMIPAGADEYFSIPILVPTSQSSNLGGSGRAVQFDEQFGQPTTGSPSNALAICEEGSVVVFCGGGNTTGSPGGGQIYYMGSVPANDGKWHDFIEHIVFATNPSVGELEIWEDGNPVTFNGPDCANTSYRIGCGSTTLHYATLIPGATTGSNNWVQLDNYRNNSPASYTSTFLHGAPAMGRSYASVQDTIFGYPHGP